MIPCKNCIVLSVCKSMMSDYIDNKHNILYRHIVITLADNCSLLRDYIKPNEYYDYDIKKREEAVDFFKNVYGESRL